MSARLLELCPIPTPVVGLRRPQDCLKRFSNKTITLNYKI